MTTKDWLLLSIPALVTLMGLFLGPKIAVRMALKQFHQQKLWEKRVEVYQTLITDMSLLQQYYSEMFTAAIHNRKMLPLSPELQTALKTLGRHANAGGFIISEQAEAAIAKALVAVSDPGYDDAQDKCDSISAALNENIKIVKGSARKDCNITFP